MILIKRSNDLSNHLDIQRKQGRKLNFVPTMGALHPGHLSLVRGAKTNSDLCICSIFVNPTQFNDPADFKKYPVTIESDIMLLETTGCDVLFLPTVTGIYPNGTNQAPHYDLGYLETVLEGKFRPGHFQGVCMVVDRLLELVMPDSLHIGQKDYQQCMVIKKLVSLVGLENELKVVISPTLREPDGLAMSSRNTRLAEDDRKKAAMIFESLNFIKKKIKKGSLDELKKQAVQKLVENGFKVDYVEIADAESLQLVDYWDGKQKLVALAAAFLSGVRLIDNVLLS
ncbi:MAG TPA: pantoate--beta-alanine ligase [Chitinophagaceae bacterium]|nr:pantoate--beta-alanine ligase [Chitinophagaceae bacterium]